MEKNADPFASFCRRLMEEKGLTILALAEMTGIDRTQLSTYLNGRFMPTPRNKKKITDALGVDYDIVMDNVVDLALAIESDRSLKPFLDQILHYYQVLSPDKRKKLIERGDELEALSNITEKTHKKPWT